MSIRGELGQQPDEMRLQDLTLEEPESKSKIEFDVEKEVSEEDWGKMRENYERYCQEGDWWEATCQAKYCKI
ncbi:MAG: hypothetical protein HQ530_04200, partial [Parcubacteria group bacterium]|nr:hypothetical protein [Parcubacteria group bacterium]